MLEPASVAICRGTQAQIGAVDVTMILHEPVALQIPGANPLVMIVPTVDLDSAAHRIDHECKLA
ncbi:hypothetical protein D3C86_2046470 [compost metagenome]